MIMIHRARGSPPKLEMEEKEAMKNKVVRKLLMVGLSSSVVLTSTVGVAAAATDTDTVVVEDSVTLDDETLAPVEDEEAPEEDITDEAEDTADTSATRTVWVKFEDEETGVILDDVLPLQIGVDDTTFHTSQITGTPEGYELCETGDVYIDNDTATVKVRKAVGTKTVWVKFEDEETGAILDDVLPLQIGANDTTFHTSQITGTPEGYELCETGDVYVDNDTAVVKVRKTTPQFEAKTVAISYQLEDGSEVAKGSITVQPYVDGEAAYYNFNTSELTDVPEGYELITVGDFDVTDTDNAVIVVKKAEAEKRNVWVSFKTEEGVILPDVALIQIEKDATQFNTSLVTVPEGYELCSVGDMTIDKDSNAITLDVRKIESTKDVIINYVDEAGNLVLTTSIKLDKDATYFNTNILTDVPYGWILANVGDIMLNEDGSATVIVRQKQYTKDIVINYVDEEGNNVFTSGIKVDIDATSINTSMLTDVPFGWELVNVGDLAIENNAVEVVVREKEYTKDIIINYVDEAGNNVYTSGMKVHKDTTSINTSMLKDVPYGWELVNVGDLTIENNAVEVVVREKEYQRDVTINYVDEEGTLIANSEIKLDMEATYFSTAMVQDMVPEGWMLANIGDVPVEKDSTATVVIRKL